MKDLADTLESLERMLGETVSGVFRTDALRVVTDNDLLGIMAMAARIGRHVEALQIEGAGHVQQRSECVEKDARLTTRMGCRSVNELLQRVTLSSRRSALAFEKGAQGARQNVAPTSGERLPAEYPALREALSEGFVGVDGLVAAIAPLDGMAGRAGRAALLSADEELAACARGDGADGGVSPTADELRVFAEVWATYLDPDGAEPREHAAMRKRTFTLGAARDGLIPLRGLVVPEVAAQFQRLCDAVLNPKLSGPAFAEVGSPDDDDAYREAQADTRTRGQKQHDLLGTILDVAARSGEMPTIGGAAPTLIVSVREEDLASGRGYAHVEGCDEPVSISTARHIACTGGVQRVISNAEGRIVSIGVLDRVFNHRQRRAIALRDGGCVIPGCHIPSSWCEIHHVEEHSRGGSTHTDNGVMLCWHHHRTIDTGGWQIRMNHGVPEIRGPNWWDVTGTWRPATKSRTRMRYRHDMTQ